jgi:hypothetical protein
MVIDELGWWCARRICVKPFYTLLPGAMTCESRKFPEMERATLGIENRFSSDLVQMLI